VAEQQGAPVCSFRHHPAHRVVAVGHGPAAVLESAAAILVRATRCLHHAIQNQVDDNNELARLLLLPSADNHAGRPAD
jgi:hypothetical protein